MVVGDPHAEQTELEDCRALIDLIVKQVKLFKPDLLLFLGDQHHNHALVHLEVLGFWKNAFEQIRRAGVENAIEAKNAFFTEIATLVGNHDMPGNGSSTIHAMLAYDVVVAQKVLFINDHTVAISYCAKEEEFRKLLAELPESVVNVFCHQTFDGSKYENGFYAKDGFSLDGLEKYRFISGHIHTPQEFANVQYVGAPRWRTISDANVDRAIWCMELEGAELSVLGKIDTSTHCSPMFYYIDRESEPLDLDKIDTKKGRIVVDIYGSIDWVAERAKVWGKSRVRTFPIVENTTQVLESKGIHVALSEYMDNFVPSPSISKENLRTVVNKRLGLSL